MGMKIQIKHYGILILLILTVLQRDTRPTFYALLLVTLVFSIWICPIEYFMRSFSLCDFTDLPMQTNLIDVMSIKVLHVKFQQAEVK